jgi:hypothetical protein
MRRSGEIDIREYIVSPSPRPSHPGRGVSVVAPFIPPRLSKIPPNLGGDGGGKVGVKTSTI